MAEYVSGEKYRELKEQYGSSSSKLVPFLVAVVVLMGLSFYGGIAYQKSKHPTSTAANGQSGSGFAGRFGGGKRPDIGQVTAISPTSITVQNSRTGTSSTLAITSSTQITDNGQTISVSDIQTGSTVLAVASTSDSSQAASIMVNPSFGGAGGAGGGGGAAAPTTTTN
jgi:hypothetical protein